MVKQNRSSIKIVWLFKMKNVTHFAMPAEGHTDIFFQNEAFREWVAFDT
jgi:hypothetical protein